MVIRVLELGLCYVNIGLHELITVKYMLHNWPVLALHQLQALKQGGCAINDFLTLFDNLKVEVNFFDDFTIHLLLQNVLLLLLNKAVLKHGGLLTYDGLI